MTNCLATRCRPMTKLVMHQLGMHCEKSIVSIKRRRSPPMVADVACAIANEALAKTSRLFFEQSPDIAHWLWRAFCALGE